MEEEFGIAEKVEEGGEVHWYWKKGIEFSYDADAKVERIFVFKPVGSAPAGFDDSLQPEQVLEHRAALERYYSRSRFQRR